MRRLSAFALIFILVVMSLAIFINSRQQQSLSERTILLHLSDCKLPCWLKIELGKMNVNKVREQLQDVYGRQVKYEIEEDLPQITIKDKTSGLVLGILLNSWTEIPTDSTLVNKIELWESDASGTQLTFSELYPVLGDPDYILLSREEGIVSPSLLYYEQKIKVDVGAVMTSQIEINPTILKITLYRDMPATDEWDYKPQVWRGFSTSYDLHSK